MTNFRITGLSPQPFEHFFDLSDDQLAPLGVVRCTADQAIGFPDRVALRDAKIGEKLLLVNYLHQPAQTPYKASHAIFIREGEGRRFDRVDEVPQVLRTRMLSLRAFDSDHMMVDADLIDGNDIEHLIERMLSNLHVAYVQAHFAKRGCYAARIERA